MPAGEAHRRGGVGDGLGADNDSVDPAAEIAWSRPPARPRARVGVVDVWRVDLDALAKGSEGRAWLLVLSVHERTRAERILGAATRSRWSASRAALRLLLGRYLERDPRELQFLDGPHGKPALAGGSELRFSLSHSRGLALVAVTARHEVGVDVEVPRAEDTPQRRSLACSQRTSPAFLARLLGDQRAREIEGLDPRLRERELLRWWTRREASIKCGGASLNELRSAAQASPAGVWTTMLDVGFDAVGALAVETPSAIGEGPRKKVCLWEWPTHWARPASLSPRPTSARRSDRAPRAGSPRARA